MTFRELIGAAVQPVIVAESSSSQVVMTFRCGGNLQKYDLHSIFCHKSYWRPSIRFL